jgi:hypothetical protein
MWWPCCLAGFGSMIDSLKRKELWIWDMDQVEDGAL